MTKASFGYIKSDFVYCKLVVFVKRLYKSLCYILVGFEIILVHFFTVYMIGFEDHIITIFV